MSYKPFLCIGKSNTSAEMRKLALAKILKIDEESVWQKCVMPQPRQTCVKTLNDPHLREVLSTRAAIFLQENTDTSPIAVT